MDGVANMAKHTHTGHCQACGRIQAVNAKHGKIAKHGYQVAGWGFFNGTCGGSDILPLEQDKEYSLYVIASLNNSIENAQARIVRLDAGTETIDECYLGQKEKRDAAGSIMRDRMGRRMYVDQFVKWEEATEYQRKAEVARRRAAAVSNINNCTTHIKFLNELIAEIHGKPLKPVEALKVMLKPGDKFEVYGKVQTVEALTERRVGWRGRTAIHVQYTNNGHTCYVQPRYCKAVQ
jgi:hypothetical protein